MAVFWLQLASKHPRKRGGERRVERNAPKPPDQATRIHSDVATTTTCFQAPSSYNFRQQHARCGCSTFRIRPRGGVRAAGWMFSPQLVSKLRWVPAFFLGFQRSPKRPAIAFLCVRTWSDSISFLKTQVIRSVLRTIKGSPRHQEV